MVHVIGILLNVHANACRFIFKPVFEIVPRQLVFVPRQLVFVPLPMLTS